MTEKLCLKCGGKLKRPATGRPPKFCSTGCRRAAEYELRRLQRRLEALEERASALRQEPDRGMHDVYGRTRLEQLAAVEAEIDEAEDRLRLLLEAGSPEDD